MEAECGSLTRALIAKVREARAEGRRSAGPAGPGGRLTSFGSGMQQLPDRLAERLGDRLLTEHAVMGVHRDGDGFRLETDHGDLTADTVLLTLPAAAAARTLSDLTPSVVEPLQQIPTVPIAVVMTGYRDPSKFTKPVRGFGVLVPGTETTGVLGTLFCHDIFGDHAPDGHVFLRTLLGGARDPHILELDDDQLVDRTRSGLETVVGSDPDPDHVWVVRWPDGISQYTLGHLDRIRAAEAAAQQVGVELAGSPYRGVSVNDCIKQARAAAGRLANRLDNK
jgi:oxygen-dependent protoporphyrinogen oxidase